MKVSLLVQTNTASYPWENSNKSFQVGRSMDCDLVLSGADCPGVSGHHAKLEFSPQGLTVWDLNSRNGTYVNDRRVQAPQPLQVGDIISLGWQGPKLKITDIAHPSARYRAIGPRPSPPPLAPTVVGSSPAAASSSPPSPAAARPIHPPPVGQPPPAARVQSQLRSPVAAGAPPAQASTPTRMLLMNLASRHRRTWFVVMGLGAMLAVALVVIFVILLTKPDETVVANGISGDESAIYKQALKHACGIGFRKDIGGQFPINGSGSVFNQKRRLIVTNYHVVHMWNSFAGNWNRPPEVAVYFPKYGSDGKAITDLKQYRTNNWHVMGKILAADRNLDLAVVQVPRLPNTTKAVELVEASPEVGQHVYLVGGNPLGSGNATWAFGNGIVRSVEHDTIHYKDQLNPNVTKIKLTAKIIRSSIPSNPGDSGAGIVNDQVRLVGVNTGTAGGAGNKLHIDITNVREFLTRNGFLHD